MGWLFIPSITTRKALLEHLRRPERYDPNQELLRSSPQGNNHWYLCRDKRDGRVWIGLDLMKGGGQNYGWGYKDIDETMGPVEVNCPLSFLDEASHVTEGYAVEWRERVRAYHAKRKERPRPAPGNVVKYGDHEYRLLKPAGPRRGWDVERVEDHARFRMRAKQLAHSQFVLGAVS